MATLTQPTFIEAWFEDLIGVLKVHQLSLETGTADQERQSFYDAMFRGDSLEVARQGQQTSSAYIVKQMLVDYIKLIIPNVPLKLAFDISGLEILVWAEIEDNDEGLEDKLIMAEAKINANYHKFGFDLTTMIVEKSENLSIPNHYSIFKD